MMTTNFRGACVLALSLTTACELSPDLLDVGGEGETGGDGDGDTGGDGDGDTGGDGDGDTGGDGDGDEPSLEPECVMQGSNLDGEPMPEDFYQLPNDCQVNCAEGWGHDVPWLESEWTLEVQQSVFAEPYARGQLAMAPDDRVVSVLSGPGLGYYTAWMTPDYGPPEVRIASLIQGDVLDFGVSDSHRYYFVWTDGVTQRLTATDDFGNDVFELELGPHHGFGSQLAVIDGGVAVALDDGDSRLVIVESDGDVAVDLVIPATQRIAASPSGSIIALANTSTLSWADAQGNFMGSEPLVGVQRLLGLIALDDTQVVFAGDEDDGSPGGGSRAILRKHGAMGPGWSHSYDRADAWCVEYQGHATEERFYGVATLGDGSLVVIGNESLGHPYGDELDYTAQPWIAHVSADGEVLAYDRGLWYGWAVDVVARDNAAYVMLTEDGSSDFFGLPYVRKYAF